MMGDKMTSTINDVARMAGVSITTVSRVLNNNYPVKRETREKIERAIKELNYKPNIIARSLITKRTGTIGVIVPNLSNIFFSSILDIIEKKLEEKGYSVILGRTNRDMNSEKNLIQGLIDRRVDGVIEIDPCKENLDNGFLQLLSQDNKLIIVCSKIFNYRCNFIHNDESKGFLEALNYLYDIGHRKIALVSGRDGVSNENKAQLYMDFLEKKDLHYRCHYIIEEMDFMEAMDKYENQAKEFLKKEEKPTAILCSNDVIALSMINSCKDLGIDVPNDMSIIGFNNTLVTHMSNPKLTTVDQNIQDISKKAVDGLLEMIEKNIKFLENKEILPTKLIVRGSTKELIY